MIEYLLFSLLVVPLLGCFFALMAKKNEYNTFNICIFTLLSNIVMILFLLSAINMEQSVFLYSFHWLRNIKTEITFGIDVNAALLLLSIYLAILISLIGLTHNQRKNKFEIINALYFLWNITGLILARDMISFYVFFAGQLLPVYMLLEISGNIRKTPMLYLFFIFNFASILCLMISLAFTYKFYNGNMLLAQISLADMPKRVAICIWLSACLAFIARIPIWPFHYWISSISATIKNPTAYTISNMLPLTGLWGFLSFWPLRHPEYVAKTIPLAVIFILLTMCFIALIGLAHKDFIRKLFSYSTIYSLFFVLSIIVLNEKYKTNMIYSLFIFMIVNSSMTTLNLMASEEGKEMRYNHRSILIGMPKLTRLLVFFVFIAAGLPISSMFWNNFVLISAIFRRSFVVGAWCVSAISVIGLALLYELYLMLDEQEALPDKSEIADISERKQIAFIMVIFILFLSFFDPLWFVF